MCTACPDPTHEMSPVDHFADLFDEYSGPIPGPAPKPVIVERCHACGGSGQFRGYSGRVVGQCFKCKGTGKLEFKTTAVDRAARKAYNDKRKVQESAKKADKIAAWEEANPMETAWINKNFGTFEFAQAMGEALNKYGSLTDGQLAAVRRCIMRNAERAEARQAQNVAAVANAVSVSIGAIETSFANAMARGIKRPKVRLATFKFSVAPAHGVNAGCIYVNEGDLWLGKIKDGKLIRSRDCTDAQEAAIVEVASNPGEAAIAYGRRTGSCAICGKELTVGVSIDRGIGPICAEKYGW